MDSDFQQQQLQHHFPDLQRPFSHPKPQVNGLTRFRSAPSSYFSSFLDVVDSTVNNNNVGGGGGGGGASGGGEKRDYSNARPLSPETENIFARFVSSLEADNNASSSQKLCNIPENMPVQPTPFMVGVKQETETLPPLQQQQGNFSSSSQQMIYQSHSKPPLANQNTSVSAVSSAMENSFRAGGGGNSMGMNSVTSQMKISGRNNTNSSGLTRHSSSPAGFFDNILNIDTGFGVMKEEMENYGGGNGQMNFSSGQATSTSGLMSQNSDAGAKRFSNNNSSNNNNDSNYMSGYPITSWDDSIMSENFSGLDRGAEDEDRKKTFSEFSTSDNQGGGARNRPPLLAHHLSLPNTSAELSAMENLMQFQDTVPCRTRAKRGCATHPRSIAERVRRTRISERMRKLQDLVPNMDKQTNTADMLDLAVDYIKELQTHVQTLADNRSKCTCSS